MSVSVNIDDPCGLVASIMVLEDTRKTLVLLVDLTTNGKSSTMDFVGDREVWVVKGNNHASVEIVAPQRTGEEIYRSEASRYTGVITIASIPLQASKRRYCYVRPLENT